MNHIDIGAELTIKKCGLNPEQLAKIKSELTFINPEYLSLTKYSQYGNTKNIPQNVEFFKENEDFIAIPRAFFNNFSGIGQIGNLLELPYKSLDLLELNENINTTNSTSNTSSAHASARGILDYDKHGKLEVTFAGKLRQYQVDFLNENSVILNEKVLRGNLCISMPCGTGKTCVALYLISLIKGRAVVVVTTNTLAKQWEDRANDFLISADANFVLVANPKTTEDEINACSILIITAALAEARVFDYSSFVVSFFDEAHRMGAKTYYPLISKMPSPYRYALTATMRRKDGLADVLNYCFGEVLRMTNPFPKCTTYFISATNAKKLNHYYKVPKTFDRIRWLTAFPNDCFFSGDYLVLINKRKIQSVVDSGTFGKPKTEFDNEVLRYCNKPFKDNLSAVSSIVSGIPEFKQEALEVLRHLLNIGRRVLVLSDNSNMLNELSKNLGAQYKIAVVVSVHNSNVKASEIEEDTQCIFGINQLAAEGLDVDFIDTLILMRPMSDIEQAYGRIRRYSVNKKSPIVIQFAGVSAFYDAIAKSNKDIYDSCNDTTLYVSKAKFLQTTLHL